MTPEKTNIAIDYLKEMQKGYIEGEGCEQHPLPEWYALDEAIKTIEQARWIPINKKSPEENGWYQCTVVLDNLSLTMDLYYKNGKWLDNRRINMFDTYDIFGYGNTTEMHKLSYQELISEFEWNQVVVAWKPLSQPYKAENTT